MKDWCQYHPRNLTHNTQLRESRHITQHMTALLPNSCGQMADGPFLDPKGRSYPHSKYWTPWWRSGINVSHGISPIESKLFTLRAPTQSLHLAFAQNILWYGVSLDYHGSKKLRYYCIWEIPVAYLILFVCINDWKLRRMQSLIRSRDCAKILERYFQTKLIICESVDGDAIAWLWCQHAVAIEMFPNLQMGAINEVGIMSLLLLISTNWMWVFINRIMKLHRSKRGAPSIHIWIQFLRYKDPWINYGAPLMIYEAP